MIRLGLGLALAVAVADQLSKWWVTSRAADLPVEVTPFFNLVFGLNQGISFGLFNTGSPAARWALSGLAVVIIAALLVWLRRVRQRPEALGIGLVVGGAVGNLIDRLRLGGVTDFLQLYVGDFYWPAFNVADSAITVGVVVLVADALFGRRESRK